jgi:putative membrane protein
MESRTEPQLGTTSDHQSPVERRVSLLGQWSPAIGRLSAVIASVVRALIWFVIDVVGNTIGLLVAWAVLPKFQINAESFVIAVLIFTAVEMLVEPFLRQMTLDGARALRGSVALVATFIGLVITDVLSTGLHIQGVSTWIFATVVVWLATLVAGLILPLFLFRRALDARGGHRRR